MLPCINLIYYVFVLGLFWRKWFWLVRLRRGKECSIISPDVTSSATRARSPRLEPFSHSHVLSCCSTQTCMDRYVPVPLNSLDPEVVFGFKNIVASVVNTPLSSSVLVNKNVLFPIRMLGKPCPWVSLCRTWMGWTKERISIKTCWRWGKYYESFYATSCIRRVECKSLHILRTNLLYFFLTRWHFMCLVSISQ